VRFRKDEREPNEIANSEERIVPQAEHLSQLQQQTAKSITLRIVLHTLKCYRQHLYVEKIEEQ
jgi:hypothetical protein